MYMDNEHKTLYKLFTLFVKLFVVAYLNDKYYQINTID